MVKHVFLYIALIASNMDGRRSAPLVGFRFPTYDIVAAFLFLCFVFEKVARLLSKALGIDIDFRLFPNTEYAFVRKLSLTNITFEAFSSAHFVFLAINLLFLGLVCMSDPWQVSTHGMFKDRHAFIVQ